MPCLAPENTYYETAKEESKWYKIEDHNQREYYYGSGSLARIDRFDPQVIKLISEDFDLHHSESLVEYFGIRDVILRSKRITQLNQDWDDEGAEGYAVSTWQRAAKFTAAQAKAARDNGLLIGVPMISPADCGSIDIHWRNADRDLLINVPSEISKVATYYGMNMRGESTSGLLDTNNARLDLLLWLSGTR